MCGQFSSVPQSYLTLYDPMDSNTNSQSMLKLMCGHRCVFVWERSGINVGYLPLCDGRLCDGVLGLGCGLHLAGCAILCVPLLPSTIMKEFSAWVPALVFLSGCLEHCVGA